MGFVVMITETMIETMTSNRPLMGFQFVHVIILQVMLARTLLGFRPLLGFFIGRLTNDIELRQLPSPFGVCFEEPKDEQPKEPLPSPRGDYGKLAVEDIIKALASVPSRGLHYRDWSSGWSLARVRPLAGITLQNENISVVECSRPSPRGDYS